MAHTRNLKREAHAAKAEYVARVNRVIDHIEVNLDRPLSLAELANVAHFSRYHFHRIFGAMVGEPLNAFVQRLRLEKAARLLVEHPHSSILEVAMDCGFSSSATFARSFKEAFSMTASQWRAQAEHKICQRERKIGKYLSIHGKDPAITACYIDPRTKRSTWRYEMTTKHGQLNAIVEVMDLPQRNVAYLRLVGPYGQSEVVPRLFDNLRTWVNARGLLTEDTLHLLVAHDNPYITEEDKLRLSICMTVPEGTPVTGEVGTMLIPGGKFAVAHFEIKPEQVAHAWNAIMGQWLPQSGFQADDRLAYEVARNNPAEHPEGKIIMDICVPVRPL